MIYENEMPLSDGDYILTDRRAWFTVGDKSVRIVMNEEGVLHVFVFETGNEANDMIGELTV